ncbi:uncharacterized protein [Leptinotarsa decemlineata]|uniref:uncharacterized protein n=1 Tax=Leptinotarsa decemlineata TaxID=7539 RepID=UPI003D30BC89
MAELIPELHPTVAIGDFNAKSPDWNCRFANTRGRDIVRLLEEFEDIEVVASNSPTYHPQANAVPSTLDIALEQNVDTTEMEVLDEGSSDHNPILFTIGREKWKQTTQQSES